MQKLLCITIIFRLTFLSIKKQLRKQPQRLPGCSVSKKGLLGIMDIMEKILIPLLLFALLSAPAAARKARNVYPLDGSYYTPGAMADTLTALAEEFPALARLHTLGETGTERKPLLALQVQSGLDKIPVLVVGQHHGDEVLGLEIALGLAIRLVRSQSDPEVSALLDRYAFWIVPTLNPEGWEVVRSGRFQWKRKNNTDTNNNRKFDLKKDGVDLNRNYPTFWSLEKARPASHPYYKGPAAASGAEVRALLSLGALVEFRYAFFYHSSVSGELSEKLFLPWRDKRDKAAKTDFDAMRRLAETYASLTPRDYQPGFYGVHGGYTSKTGNARNHFYHTWQTLSLLIEVGGSPGSGRAVIHPGPDMRRKIVAKNVSSLVRTLLRTELP